MGHRHSHPDGEDLTPSAARQDCARDGQSPDRPCSCSRDGAADADAVAAVTLEDAAVARVPAAARLRTLGRRTDHRFVRGQKPLVPPESTEKKPEDEELIASCLRDNPNWKVLAPFGEEQIKFLVETAWKEEIEPGQAIMLEGDLDNTTFYVVASGTFNVEASDPYEVVKKDGNSYLSRADPEPSKATDGWIKSAKGVSVCHQVGSRTCFGDSSMLYAAPRWTTAVATEQSVVWIISQANFRIAQLEVSEAQPTAKSDEDKELIKESLLRNTNLQRLTPLDERHIEELAKVAWSCELQAGQVLMHQGDLNADSLYIVGSGRLELRGSEPFGVVRAGNVSFLERAAHTGAKLLRDDHPRITTAEFGRGHMFGEVSMSYCAPRFATVTAVEKSVLWAIDRSNFQMVQMQAAEDEVLDRVRHLESVEAIQSFNKYDKEKMAAVMETMRFRAGENMTTQGESAHAMFILLQGRVERLVGSNVIHTYEADKDSNKTHRLSEESLLVTHSRRAVHACTLRVVSETATALVLEREEFQKVWDRLLEAAPAPSFERFRTSVTKGGDQTSESIAMSRLTTLGLLGAGSLGPIELCRHKKTRELYAMKKMSKGLIIRRGFTHSVLEERHVWIEVLSPFVVRLLAANREDQSLNYILEFCAGGELSEAYARQNLYGSAKHAKFYVAGVVLACEHLHKRKIIYRNLKPQNVLLGAHGRPKITDLSLAKRLTGGHTFTTCGTPTFMAPEILTGGGHTRAVDWWSVGVFAFWLMAGAGPFDSEHPMDIYARALRGIARVEFPEVCCAAVKDFVTSLLSPEAIDRPPMRQGGVRNVTEHAWFSGFKWKSMREGNMHPPYSPKFSMSPTRWKDDCDVPPQVCLRHFAPLPERLPTPVHTEANASGWDDDFVTR